MAYITNADIERRLGSANYIHLTDDLSTGVADATVADEARQAAEGEVDAYLGRRYAVPVEVASSPELAGLLAGVALDLAVNRLHGRRPPVPDDVRLQADRSRLLLARLSTGEAVLPSGAELPANAAAGPAGQAVGHRRVLVEKELTAL